MYYTLLCQVQQEILQKRKEEKRAAVDAVKKFRKGKGEKPSFLRRDDDMEDEAFPVIAETEKVGGAQKKGGPRERSKKRQQKVSFLNSSFVLLLSMFL